MRNPVAVIQNPILRGFNPDPSIVRVGDDYYIATSTFEWFPGVQIHHSRDLAHWRLLTRPLNRDAFPQRETTAPELSPHLFPPPSTREDFDGPTLPIEFQWLRSPWRDELFSLTARPGYLRLFGRETTGSLFRQALVARRQQAHCYSASTAIEFEPRHYQQQAGLICYYNGSKFHYLYVSTDEVAGKHIRVMTCHPELPDMFTAPIPIDAGAPVRLRVEVDYEHLRFAFRVGGGDWQWLPEQFDASILSDEAGPPGPPNFTGAFVGMCCQDYAGTGYPADFDYFEYGEREFSAAPYRSSLQADTLNSFQERTR